MADSSGGNPVDHWADDGPGIGTVHRRSERSSDGQPTTPANADVLAEHGSLASGTVAHDQTVHSSNYFTDGLAAAGGLGLCSEYAVGRGMTVSECLRRVQYRRQLLFETMVQHEAILECLRSDRSSGSGWSFETLVTTGTMDRQPVYYVPRG